MKRFQAAALALFFLGMSVIQPARAFAPPAAPLPMMFTAVTPAGAVAIGAAIAVGMVVGSIMATDSATGQNARIPTNSTSSSQLSTPSASATTTPSGGGKITEYVAVDNSWGTIGHACTVYGAQTPFDIGYGGVRSFECLGAFDGYFSARAIDTYATGAFPSLPYQVTPATRVISEPLVCPSGYSVVGSVCELSDARAAVADQNIDYSYNGSTISPASLNDKDLSDTTLYVVSNGEGTQVSIVGRDANGNLQQLVMSPVSGGGMRAQLNTSSNAGTSTGTITQTQFVTDSTGTVTQLQTSSASGQLSYDTSTGTATATSNPTFQNPDGTTSSLPTTQPKLDVQFPTDYARQGEAQNAAKPLQDALANTQDVADPALPDVQGFNDAFFNGTFANLLGWSLPSHASTCPTGSFSFNGSTYTVDAHCQLIQDHWNVLQAAMVVVWTIVALFIVLAA